MDSSERFITVSAGKFQAGGGREKAVPVLPSSHARRFEQITGKVIMKWIFAGRISPVDRDAFETVNRLNCDAKFKFHAIF